MLVLSNIKVVSSTISCWINCTRTFSHTPAFVHARNRLYTLCQGPNLSGRSLQGMPVFSQYTMALSISRLLFAGRPPCGFCSIVLRLIHVFSYYEFTILALCTQLPGFKTRSSPSIIAASFFRWFWHFGVFFLCQIIIIYPTSSPYFRLTCAI